MEEHNYTRNNIEKICRTCSNYAYDSLVPATQLEYKKYNLIEILSFCTGVQIDQNELLPLNICSRCISETKRSFDFRIQCKQSDFKLRQSFNQTLLGTETVNTPITTQVGEFEEIWLDAFESEPIEIGVGESSPVLLEEREEDDENKHGNDSSLKLTKAKRKSVKDGESSSASMEENKDSNESSRKPKQAKRKSIKDRESSSSSMEEKEEENKDSNDSSRKPKQVTRNERDNRVTKKFIKDTKPPKSCCKQIFDTRDEYLLHRKYAHPEHKNFICEHCGKAFRDNFKLREHMTTHTGEQPYQCEVCAMRFNRRCNFDRHKLKHTSRVKTDKGKDFLCTYCGKTFSNKTQLYYHSKGHEKPYSCSKCDKRFSYLQNLKLHFMIHTGEKPCVCLECGQAFRQKIHLKQHQRTHTGEKPFECSFCGKGFALNGNLTAHVRIHTGETPFSCSMCDKAFNHLSRLRKHERTTHGAFKAAAKNFEEDMIATENLLVSQ